MKEKQDNTSGTAHPAFPNHSRETYVWENASAIAARSQVRASDWGRRRRVQLIYRLDEPKGSLQDFEFSRPRLR